MQKQAYPYCPHGSYTGGCGPDFMCGACEMGELPPTMNEQRAYMRHLYTNAARKFADALAHPNPYYRVHFGLFVMQEAAKVLAHQAAAIAEIRQWAEGDDDAGWLYRKHEAAIAAWSAASGEEQFANLPAHVLDGSY